MPCRARDHAVNQQIERGVAFGVVAEHDCSSGSQPVFCRFEDGGFTVAARPNDEQLSTLFDGVDHLRDLGITVDNLVDSQFAAELKGVLHWHIIVSYMFVWHIIVPCTGDEPARGRTKGSPSALAKGSHLLVSHSMKESTP